MQVKNHQPNTVISTYPLSEQQRRLWLQSERWSSCAQSAVLIEGPLLVGALEDSIRSVVERNEILRTTFNRRLGMKLPFQSVRESLDFDWREVFVPEWGSAIDEAELAATVRQQASQPFDLEHGPVLRILLMHISERRNLLLICLPSLCADAITLRTLVAEFGRACIRSSRFEGPSPSPLQYSEFASWQSQIEQQVEQDEDRDAQRALAHWAKQDISALAQMEIPKASTAAIDGAATATCSFYLAREVVDSLDSMSERLDLSVRALLSACWHVIGSRLTGQPKLVVGEVFEGRQFEDFKDALGLYARVLPIGSSLGMRLRFSSLARQLQELQAQATEFADYAVLDDDVRFPICFEYQERASRVEIEDLSFEFLLQHVWIESFQLKLNCTRIGRSIGAEISFDTALFREADIRLLQERFLALVDAVIKDPGTAISDLPVLGATEHNQIVIDFNESAVSFEPCGSIQQLFEAQVDKTPNAVAIVCGEQQLTYDELNQRANRVAHYLEAQGSRVEERVGLLIERSEILLIGLLGILKAGGAYVPLDPSLPKERIGRQLQDSDATLVLTSERLAELLPIEGGSRPVYIDDAVTGAGRDDNPPPRVIDGNLAYVLFTSGSTGRPKGVAVEHRQLINYIYAIGEKLLLPPAASFALVSTFAADLGNTMIFPALCGGGCLHIVSQELATDPSAFGDYLLSHGVDCLKIVPSHLGALLQSRRPQDLLPGVLLVLGGEAAPVGLVEQVKELAPECRIMNHYGPTETTVGVTTFERQHLDDRIEGALPIGRPLANCEIYLLDSNLRPVPAMTEGELCIGGACLSRGYLGRPDLTAERFVPNPTDKDPGARIYRTGDLARFRPEKTVEFLGRIDNQVKIRGFRIELGEIETALSGHPDVWRAVAVARSTAAQTKQLVAYIVARPGSDVSQSDLRAELSKTLPEYMVPSAIEFLDSLPLTANGKVDREGLSAGQIKIDAGDQQALPGTAEEKALAEIWAGVLGIPRVGIHDNFFELGGDSILAIQVVARANRVGLRLTPKQIFDEQTIAGLARVAGSSHQIEAEQGLVTGPVALNPIQHWFFERSVVEPNHWNQSVILEVPPRLGPDLVETAVMVVIAHHDALRLRFEQTADGWRQSIVGMDEAAKSFSVIDVTSVPEADLRAAIEPAAQQLQAGLNLSEGPICKFTLFNLGDDRPHRLLIIAHHLAVDGVSWGVILEDLEAVCDQLLRNQPIDLPPKTSSFKQWSERLAAHVGAGAFSEEMPFWLQEGGEFASVPQDGDGPNTIASATSVECSLDREETSIFLHQLPEAYGTQINAILLTAIARGFASCTGSTRLLVEMEGHGREGIFEDIDISRTVGWFTIHFPVLLDIGGAMNSHEALKLTKDQLRRIPNNGIGFGLLRYLSMDPDNVARLRALPTPDIKFNYLGRYDQVYAKPRFFGMADEFRGGERNPRSSRSHLIDVDALVLGERLRLKWTFSENIYNRHTISRLANAVRDELRRLISLKDAGQQGLYAPSDFPLVQLNERRLEHIAQTVLADRDGIQSEGGPSERQIEDIYPVSPLQESLLSHSLSTQGSGTGFEQKSLLLRGDFDSDAFNRTWQELVDRHPILRTAFVGDSLGGPLQVVLRRVRIPIEHQDWRSMPSSQQEVELEQYLRADRGRGFDLASPPLMRVGVIRLSEDIVRLVWSYHHLLIDAWCRNLVLQEVFEIYDARHNGRVPELPERRPCRDYIGWLQKQDYVAAEQFWRDLLKGFVTPTSLPIGRRAKPGARTEHYKTQVLQFTPSETDTVASFAKTNRLTLNTLLHAAWALLLSRYCDTEDVLFGTTVAGRPPELSGSESMLGMFINNLPVRVQLPGDSSVLSVLRELQGRLVSMREYEWISPLKLQEWSDLSRGNRLFESLLIFQNYPLEGDLQGAKTGLEMRDVRSRLETAYPFTVVAGPFEPLTIRIFYDSRQLEDSEIGRISEHLRTALIGIVSSQRVSDISILTEEERRPLVSGRHRAGLLAAKKVCAHRLIEQQAYRTPDDIALKGQQGVLSWNEMNCRANRLARQLTKAGAGPERLVAVLLDRTVEFVIGLLAVLKTGAGFVVIDHSASYERISDELERTRPQALLISRTLHLTLPGLKARVVFADSGEAGAESDRNLVVEDDIKGVACVRFASGMDLPIETTHEALFEQASTFASVVAPSNSDSILIAAASPAVAAIEALTALAAGAQAVIAGDESLHDSSRLMQELRDSSATIMQAPPVTWQLLLEKGWAGTPDFKAICPTRRLPARLCRELSARTGCLIKVYKTGADERWLAACQIEPNDGQRDFGLIGTPVDWIAVQLLSRDSQQIPIGVTGEICIGNASDGAHFWRTGDLGRRLEDGRVEVRGRLDRRVKTKGGIIDPFDVESELLAYPALRDVAAMVWENSEGEKWLGAYIVADFSAIGGVEQLVDFAKTKLPRHAIPDFFVALDRLPLTRDGEVDYQALPPPDATGVHVEVVWQEFCDPVQLRVKRIWEDLFAFQPIGIRENFFELGGHSILAVRLMSEISKQFGRDLPISILLNGATIEHLADVVRAEAEPDSWSPLVQIQAGIERLPLFCVHATGGEVLNYVELAHYLGPDQPVYGLQSRGFAQGREGVRRIEEMATCYLEAMRKVQPHGPFCITGYSFGGVIALEMAQQLYSAGERLTWLGVLDTNLMDNLPGREVATRFGADNHNTADWAQLILNCARHGTTITADDLREIGSLEDQVAYAIEHGILPYNLDLATALRYVKAGDDNSEAKSLYVSKPYPGKICLLRALQGHVLKCADPTLGWGSVALGGLEISDVPGAHWNMLGKPHVQVIASRIRAFMDRVQAERPIPSLTAGSA